MNEYFDAPTADQHRRSRIAIQNRHESEVAKQLRAERKKQDEREAWELYGVRLSYSDIEPWGRWK